MKILITSGATREPIDVVRFISNVSTGRTGALLADELGSHDHHVTLLHGEGAVLPNNTTDLLAFGSTENLDAQLRRSLGTGSYDAVIHCAAVADYRPAEAGVGKLSSYATGLTLQLVPTPKLLPALKHYAPRPLVVIGFKLTSSADEVTRDAAVAKLFAAGTVDAVIHNDMATLSASDRRAFRAYEAYRPLTIATTLAGTIALANWLNTFVIGHARSG